MHYLNFKKENNPASRLSVGRERIAPPPTPAPVIVFH